MVKFVLKKRPPQSIYVIFALGRELFAADSTTSTATNELKIPNADWG